MQSMQHGLMSPAHSPSQQSALPSGNCRTFFGCASWNPCKTRHQSIFASTRRTRPSIQVYPSQPYMQVEVTEATTAAWRGELSSARPEKNIRRDKAITSHRELPWLGWGFEWNLNPRSAIPHPSIASHPRLLSIAADMQYSCNVVMPCSIITSKPSAEVQKTQVPETHSRPPGAPA